MGSKQIEENDYSLYDMFTLGDRVARTFKDKYGHETTRSGIIMAVDENRVTILWDHVEENYQQKEDIKFSSYDKNEILETKNTFEFLKKHGNKLHY